MAEPEIPTSAMEPFNVGRSTFRLLFDFGVMLSCFSSSPNKRVLDFGAGTGWISEFLARLGYEVYALDIDKGMPASIHARASADRRLASTSITPVTGSGMNLPFPNGFFSHVCCFDTLHHMHDYPQTFREMSRVLEAGGRAVFIEPGARHSRSPETIEFIRTYKQDDPTWIERDVVLDEITQISRKSGFSTLVVLPTLLPGLKSYTSAQWSDFRQGNPALVRDYINLLADFNYNDHLSFYCEKTSSLGAEISERLDSMTFKTESIVSSLFGKKIAIDLTPMLPGGENGGAKLMTIELVRALAGLLPDTSFVLFTAEVSHGELDYLENDFPNIQRRCVLHNSTTTTSSMLTPSLNTTWRGNRFAQLKSLVQRLLPSGLRQRIVELRSLFPLWKQKVFDRLVLIAKRVLPLRIRKQLGAWWWKRSRPAPVSVSLVREIGADLLFCPFTAPFYADPQIPTVSVIYDLQYRAYPQFFTPEEFIQREDNFRMAYEKASDLVTISEFVKRTVLESTQLSSDHVSAVPIGLLRTPELLHEVIQDTLLEKYGLNPGEYIVYPANFWRHKNHAMLLTAFNLYRSRRGDSKLKLVCTGTPGRQAEGFCEDVRRMGLEEWVTYPGYLRPDEYDSLLRSAFAMIFPSLYEGFGIPLLEAMAAGVPVLCSDVTSLPEVGGEAVLYFDPRRPAQIVESLIRLSEEPGLRDELVAKGYERVQLFEGAERMAIQYMTVFKKALSV